MKIERLKLTNFRNYLNLEIELSPNINVFVGNNGEGKTNILESIYVLSLTKSNRLGQEYDLIKFNEDIAKIEGIIKSQDIIKKKEIHITKGKKQLFINNKEIRKNRDYIGGLSVVLFTPQDLEIIKGSPNIRRNMLNIDISQLHNSYINYLNEYNQIIKMRNEYLRRMNINGNTDERYLEIINNELIKKATKIYEYRFNFIEMVNKYLEDIFRKITGFKGLKIYYNNSIGIEKFNSLQIEEIFRLKFKKNINIEMMQGMTLIGPHRDDFSFILDNKDMKIFSSQGQQRMAVISLKLSEIYLFKESLNEYPILLLDDVFSEIDIKKRNKIIKYLKNDIQTIITTTDINDINKNLLEKSVVYNVKNNKVTRKGRIKNGR